MRVRLILSFVGIVIFSIVTVVVLARQGSAAEVRTFMYRGGMVDLNVLVEELQDYYRQHGSWEGAASLLPGGAAGGHGQGMGPGGPANQGGMMRQRFRLADAQGRLISDTAGTSAGQLTASELQQAVPLRVGLQTVGYLLTEGGMGFTYVEERFLVGRLSRAAVTAGLLAGGLSLLLALALSFILLRPVRQLTQAAARLGQGDLSVRVPVSGEDELAVLGRTFNQMADSLQKAEEARRAMTADIAHELRNPLAVQRASLEALQDGIYPLTAENLQPILEQNLLLSRLVDDLRTLALADAGQLTLERRPGDLAAFVEQVLERFQPQAARQQIQLLFSRPEQALPSVAFDPLRLDQALSNLLSNAIRYTPAGGSIRLELSCQVETCRLTVHDSGPGIPEEALPYIFDRFYRADRARSRQEGGSGLGLAIARQLVEAHGGTLRAANHPQGGAIFTITLPLAERG